MTVPIVTYLPFAYSPLCKMDIFAHSPQYNYKDIYIKYINKNELGEEIVSASLL
jgi:hypothetical protein